MAMELAKLRATLASAGQQDVLRFWDDLNDLERAELVSDIESIDWPTVQELVDGMIKGDMATGVGPDWQALAARSTSPSAIRLSGEGNRWSESQARLRGEQMLRDGRVAAMVVAGGQGTRLGFDHPKGMYPIGPVSQRTLFEIFIDRLVATSRRYETPIPLLVMTSPATHDETVEYFNRLGGARPDLTDVTIFSQGVMPSVSASSGREAGKVLLASKSRLALNPDGHGGALRALDRSGTLAKLQQRGIEQIFYWQVDNPMVSICDPVFLGYHALAGSEMTSQVIAKTEPLEKVGNVVSVDGALQIIEYSDLPESSAMERNEDGSLRIWAGSIAVHVFDIAFLARMAAKAGSLPFHVARKAVGYVDGSGEFIKPREPNAIKFERFIFDLLPAARNGLVVEIDPAEGFSPLKNASGAAEYTPEMVQDAMVQQHRRWIEAAGARVGDDVVVEINPMFAWDACQLRERLAPGTVFSDATYLHCR